MGDLFGDTPVPRLTKKLVKEALSSETEGLTLRLEKAWDAAYLRRWKIPALHKSIGRDRKHFADLGKLLGEEEVTRLIDLYFTTRDRRIDSGPYEVGIFYSLISYLRELEQRQLQHIDPTTQANIEAAQRATGRRLK